MKILIAEDEPALRQNLQWMLEMEGFEVLTACDGHDAFTQACAMCPDLLITDVMMPNMDGYALVKALREHPATATLPTVPLPARVAPVAMLMLPDTLPITTRVPLLMVLAWLSTP